MFFSRCKPVESKTRTYHGRVGAARRTARRRGGAGTGRTGRRRFGSPKMDPSLVFSRQWGETLLGVSLEARTDEFLHKPVAEQNERLTSGLSAFFSARPRALFIPGC